MKILALAVVLALTGCAQDDELSQQPTQAEAQIRRWVPIGTSLADAQRIMEQHHFHCSMMTNSTFGDFKAAAFLYCDRRVSNTQVGASVLRRWQAALVLVDGKISVVRVTTGSTGP